MKRKVLLSIIGLGVFIAFVFVKGCDSMTNMDDAPHASATDVASSAPTQDDIAFGAAFMIRKAIRAKAADPDGVDFVESTYKSQHGDVYDEKYIISGKNAFNARVRAAGYAKVKYLGGDPNDGSNWQLLESYIDE